MVSQCPVILVVQSEGENHDGGHPEQAPSAQRRRPDPMDGRHANMPIGKREQLMACGTVTGTDSLGCGIGNQPPRMDCRAAHDRGQRLVQQGELSKEKIHDD